MEKLVLTLISTVRSQIGTLSTLSLCIKSCSVIEHEFGTNSLIKIKNRTRRANIVMRKKNCLQYIIQIFDVNVLTCKNCQHRLEFCQTLCYEVCWFFFILKFFSFLNESTVHSRFKKARFKKESQFKKDCCYNRFLST